MHDKSGAMIDDKVCAALNGQLRSEFYSAYLYAAMYSHFESRTLKGFANWMQIQVQEELAHAQKLIEYILERGGEAEFRSIDAPESEWDSPLGVYEAALEHERSVTRAINDLVDIAVAARDHATATMLQWYVTEQVEEEATFDEIVQQLKLADGNGAALLMIDRELGARVFTPPGTVPK
jgi:ferritin